MPVSMTGFGRGAVKVKGIRYVAEARSVNNRFCEVRVQAPKELLGLEHRLAARVRERFERGKFDVLLKIETASGGRNERKDEAAVIRRWRELETLRKRLGLKDPVRLETALAQTPVPSSFPGEEAAEKHLLQAAEEALDRLEAFRRKEGAALARDVRARAVQLRRMTQTLGGRAAKGAAERMARLRERVAELSGGRAFDSARLESEMALLADRSDVTEEITRLESHLGNLLETVETAGSVGRKLDFLLQEVNREVNTIGAKANDLGSADLVVTMKSEVEKIREQVQNLE
jgi:uncharacterized protein (TIGR00255 family)